MFGLPGFVNVIQDMKPFVPPPGIVKGTLKGPQHKSAFRIQGDSGHKFISMPRQFEYFFAFVIVRKKRTRLDKALVYLKNPSRVILPC